ncbi:MAG: hypothetical protein LBV20_05135, partial [Treponema sp.]|nr:hypothetical protein [Treponema sp.]
DRENETALHELAYIEEKTGKIPPAPSSKEEVAEIVKVLEDNDIQAWGNPKVYNIAVSLAQEAMKAEMPNETRFFLGVAYDLSGDEEIGQILEKMDAAAAEQRDYDEDDFEPDEGRYDGEV